MKVLNDLKLKLPPSSTNLVMASTLRDPPNSSTDGEKITRFLYRYCPYFANTKLESSTGLKTSEYPRSEISVKKTKKQVAVKILFQVACRQCRYYLYELN